MLFVLPVLLLVTGAQGLVGPRIIPVVPANRAPFDVGPSFVPQKVQVNTFRSVFVPELVLRQPELPVLRPEGKLFGVLKTDGKVVTFLGKVQKAPNSGPGGGGGEPEDVDVPEEGGNELDENDIGIPWDAATVAGLSVPMWTFFNQPYVRWTLAGQNSSRIFEELLNRTVDLAYQDRMAEAATPSVAMDGVPSWATRTRTRTSTTSTATTKFDPARTTDPLYSSAVANYLSYFRDTARTIRAGDTLRARQPTSDDDWVTDWIRSMLHKTNTASTPRPTPKATRTFTPTTPPVPRITDSGEEELYETLAAIWAGTYSSVSFRVPQTAAPTPTIQANTATRSVSYTLTSTPVETITIMPLYVGGQTVTMTRYDVMAVPSGASYGITASRPSFGVIFCILGIVLASVMAF